MIKGGKATVSKKNEDHQSKVKRRKELAKVLSQEARESFQKNLLMGKFIQNMEKHFGGVPSRDEAVYERGKKKIREGMELMWQSFRTKKGR